jgi:hypothetical protein
MSMLEHLTTEGVAAIIAMLASVVGGNTWVTAALIDRKLAALNGTYVRVGECLLRTEGAQREMNASREEGRLACAAATVRDEITQERIHELSRVIAAALLGNREIVDKLDRILVRERG